MGIKKNHSSKWREYFIETDFLKDNMRPDKVNTVLLTI
jgi:predicted urease superfamily metal-dependent hydrolase